MTHKCILDTFLLINIARNIRYGSKWLCNQLLVS